MSKFAVSKRAEREFQALPVHAARQTYERISDWIETGASTQYGYLHRTSHGSERPSHWRLVVERKHGVLLSFDGETWTFDGLDF